MHLSPVQEFALELVLVGEARDKGRDALHDFKMAVVGADPKKYIPIVYPEWLVKRDAEITTEDIEDSQGEWVFEDDTPLTQEEIEATLADLMTGEMELGADEAALYDDDWNE